MRTVGVEEELLLVDPETGEPRALPSAVLDRMTGEGEGGTDGGGGGAGDEAFEKELHRQQLEFATRPHDDMDALGDEITARRREAGERVAESGAAVAALATSPLPVSPSVNPGSRYLWMQEHFGLPVRELLSCGCHVHVSVASDEEGVAVLDRIRPWLQVLVALSANSPFWQGKDSRYASYRSQVWGRWPMAGPVELFGTADTYHQVVTDMVATGVLRDRGMVYFDARLSHTYPTVEIRVADVCLDARDTVLIATLARGLVERAARDARTGRAPEEHPVSLLRLATWRAARSGLDGELLHPVTLRPTPAEDVVRALLDHVADDLERAGDLQRAEDALKRLLRDGTGARTQRELLHRHGSLGSVVTDCARLTVG
ncbi:glutamate--cysteine ligase [Streptomyces sp. NPDC001941]|uniref:glutamate--cysteine ligase n=1 Tax=Streptomyces sp. NPDC001941 TaxID=3154659 RepID=UPI00332182E2